MVRNMEAIANLFGSGIFECLPQNVDYYFAALALGLLIYTWYKSRTNLPPGPYGLPFVGYSPFLGDRPSEKFTELSKKYGSIFSVRIGKNLVVILNDYEAMTEVLGNQNSLDRGPVFDFLSNVGFAANNGEEWIEQRRSSMQIIKEVGIGRSHWECFMQEKAGHLADILRSYNGKPVYFEEELEKSLVNSNIYLLIGRGLKEGKEEKLLTDYSRIALTEGSTSSITTQIPILRKLLEYLGIYNFYRNSKLVDEFLRFLRGEITQHQEEDSAGAEDFINMYMDKMKQMKTLGKKNFFSEHNLLGNLNVMFLGAIDTVLSSTIWIYRLMAAYPDVQAKVQRELDEVIGCDGVASYENRSSIPYTVSVIMECLRFSSIVPMSTSRSAVSDFKVRNYVIPKGCQISANMKAIHFDHRYWQEPEKFKPERFLKNDGKQFEANPKSYVPFSFGRRNCPGDRIAWMEIMNFFIAIVQKFTIVPPPGEAVNFEQFEGLVYKLKSQPLCFLERKT